MLPLILAAAGLLKGETIDRDKEMTQAKLQAATTRYSPWTRMQAADPERADPWGQAIAGAAMGAAMDQNNLAFDSQQKLRDSQTRLNDRAPGIAAYGGALNSSSVLSTSPSQTNGLTGGLANQGRGLASVSADTPTSTSSNLYGSNFGKDATYPEGEYGWQPNGFYGWGNHWSTMNKGNA